MARKVGMQPIELTIVELEQLYEKQASYRARVYLEWAIENLKKFQHLDVAGAVNRTKRQ